MSNACSDHVPRRRRRRVAASGRGLVAAALVLSACNGPAAVTGRKLLAVGAENEYANVIAQIGGRYVSVDRGHE